MNKERAPKDEVIVFTGSGRGKTTAAVGVTFRTISRGGKVIFIYFTGPLDCIPGEVKVAAKFGNNWRMIGIRSEVKDVTYLHSFTESVNTVREALNMAQQLWLYECDLLVLDGISPHLTRGSIDVAELLAIIDNCPKNTGIVLTGTSFPESIIQKAGLVTEFKEIKHPKTERR